METLSHHKFYKYITSSPSLFIVSDNNITYSFTTESDIAVTKLHELCDWFSKRNMSFEIIPVEVTTNVKIRGTPVTKTFMIEGIKLVYDGTIYDICPSISLQTTTIIPGVMVVTVVLNVLELVNKLISLQGLLCL